MSAISPSRIINHHDIQLIEEDISCPICKLIIVDPTQCKQCESTLCLQCGDECQKSKGSCPICIYQGSVPFYSLTVSRVFKNLLSKVQIECVNKFDGCNILVNLENFKKHSQECQFRREKCKSQDCKKLLFPHEMQMHILECEYTETTCKFCKNTLVKKELKDHEEECPLQLIPCKWCKISYLLRDLKKHSQSCQLKKIPCLECNQVFILREYQNHSRAKCQSYQYDQNLREYSLNQFEKNINYTECVYEDNESSFHQPYSNTNNMQYYQYEQRQYQNIFAFPI